METGPDPDSGNRAIEKLKAGDIDALLDNVTHESMAAPGNATHGFLNFILMLGVAGPAAADYAGNLDLFHTREPCLT